MVKKIIILYLILISSQIFSVDIDAVFLSPFEWKNEISVETALNELAETWSGDLLNKDGELLSPVSGDLSKDGDYLIIESEKYILKVPNISPIKKDRILKGDFLGHIDEKIEPIIFLGELHHENVEVNEDRITFVSNYESENVFFPFEGQYIVHDEGNKLIFSGLMGDKYQILINGILKEKHSETGIYNMGDYMGRLSNYSIDFDVYKAEPYGEIEPLVIIFTIKNPK